MVVDGMVGCLQPDDTEYTDDDIRELFSDQQVDGKPPTIPSTALLDEA